MGSRRAVLLWVLQGLFVARVLGQIYVGLYAPAWLPPWIEWYSGLLPYPLLLPAQLLLVIWMTMISYDNTRLAGAFHVESPRVRSRLRVLAAIYAGIMLVRYGLTMVLRPDMRWLHGTIPVAFHLVLAAYLAVLAIPADAHRPGDRTTRAG